MTQDEEYLKLLSIFHYVVGGIIAIFACFPLFHLFVGVTVLLSPDKGLSTNGPPVAVFAWMFILMALVMIVVGWVLAVLVIVTGRCLARRTHRMFCLVLAGIECIFMPLGTILGVFTIVLLMKDSVRQLFVDDRPADDFARSQGS